MKEAYPRSGAEWSGVKSEGRKKKKDRDVPTARAQPARAPHNTIRTTYITHVRNRDGFRGYCYTNYSLQQVQIRNYEVRRSKLGFRLLFTNSYVLSILHFCYITDISCEYY